MAISVGMASEAERTLLYRGNDMTLAHRIYNLAVAQTENNPKEKDAMVWLSITSKRE